MDAVALEIVVAVRDACLCLHAQRAARALARRFDLAFAPVGITNGQFSLMIRLSAPDRPTIAALATFLAMDRTTATAALKALEARGFVTLERDHEDRRAKRPALTAAGRAALAQALAIWRREHPAYEASLGASGVDADALRGMLRVMG